ncbi:hypothetical protein ACGFX4_09210 [Kitasatospora sp. NPDC048365]|uniref:hypothetical protein n=1 Tax=Kitasatospora sp. NPDC048365 TaxID=3364050 RepID=UPI003723B38C
MFTYRVDRDRQVLREAFTMWPLDARELGAEVEAGGLRGAPAPWADLMAVRRPPA